MTSSHLTGNSADNCLAELSQAVAPGAHGIVLMDKAGIRLAISPYPKTSACCFCRPTRPSSTRSSGLWLYLRDNRLSHCVFRTTEEIIDSACQAWNWLLGQTGCIRSLCSYPWLKQVSD